MLAKEAEAAFDNKDWIFEIKWDGYRAIAEIKNNTLKLYSRNGNSLSNSYPIIADELANMGINAVLDGEIVALDENGAASFQLLQNYNGEQPLFYYVFDLLFINNKNNCSLPLIERKRQLKKILKKNNVIKYTDHIKEKGINFFKLAIKNNLEGIMAKQADSIYVPGTRTSDWLKIKHHKTQEAIIAGYTSPKGSRLYFGSLVLAVRSGNKLNYIGQTGSGFNSKTLKTIYDLLKPLRIKHSPFQEAISLSSPFTPVKPSLVCEVQYTEITDVGKLRHPVFLKLRNDKKANEISGIENQISKSSLNKPNLSQKKKTTMLLEIEK